MAAGPYPWDMAQITFDVVHTFEQPARVVWDDMIDWERHADWIPATRMEVPEGDTTAPGATFTAYTGYKPLVLEDRMKVVECNWDETATSGRCEVEKLGPVLKGMAAFTITQKDEGTELVWTEDVVVPYVPQFLAAPVRVMSAAGFKFGMKQLAKNLAKRETA